MCGAQAGGPGGPDGSAVGLREGVVADAAPRDCVPQRAVPVVPCTRARAVFVRVGVSCRKCARACL